jgi:hypothetical protein
MCGHFARYKREFVLTVMVMTEFDCNIVVLINQLTIHFPCIIYLSYFYMKHLKHLTDIFCLYAVTETLIKEKNSIAIFKHFRLLNHCNMK